MSLQQRLESIARETKKTFTLKGRPVSYAEMFTPHGILPSLAKRADQLSSLCLGYGLGIKLEDDQDALLGAKVQFDEFTPDILRLFCITDSLFDLIRMSPSANEVPLDELLYD